MYVCYVASYDLKKDGLKKISQRKVTKKLEKERAIFFVCDTLSYTYTHTHCYKVSPRYSIWLPIYRTHKDSVKKNQREVTWKQRKGDQSVLHATHRLNLMYFAMKFHEDIPYGYLLMVPTRSVKNFIKGK